MAATVPPDDLKVLQMVLKSFIVIGLIASAVMAVDVNDHDFACEVISYTPGTGQPFDWLSGAKFSDPQKALGRPTLVTTGDDDNPNDSFVGIPVSSAVDVSPVYGPFRSFEVVSIGNGGGQLTLKFDHPVANDHKNPYDLDFIIFGNARQTLPANTYWRLDSDADIVHVSGEMNNEDGIVSVSQDGVNWFTFENGPYADSFAPTAARSWDAVNHCWGEYLNPTKPVNPALTPEEMNGKTVAEMVGLYDGSAGGTGFDIGVLGLDWIQYVRIQDDPSYAWTTEIDAIADVTACGDYRHPFPAGDLNQDCMVNMLDFAIAANTWITNQAPFMDVVDTWLDCTWMCN